MFAGGYPGDGRWREASRGVGDAAPCGLPGNGRQREPAPHPALRGHLPPRGKARAVIPPGVLAGGFRGVGDAAPTVCPGMGGDGSLPLIRPCGATFPQGGRQGLLLAAAGGRGGVGAPRPTDGDMETLRGLRGHPFPDRRTVGAGHARPGGLRGHPSMVRPVGRGLDPSAGDCPGDGCWRKVSRGVGDAAPYGLPGNRQQRKVAAGWGHPALRMGIWKRPRGLRGHPFPGRRTVGAGHARPGGWREHPSMVRSVGRGLDPSAGDCPGDGRWRKVSRGVGDAAPCGLPGNRQQRKAAAGWGPPALRMGIWKRCGGYAGTRSRAAAR